MLRFSVNNQYCVCLFLWLYLGVAAASGRFNVNGVLTLREIWIPCCRASCKCALVVWPMYDLVRHIFFALPCLCHAMPDRLDASHVTHHMFVWLLALIWWMCFVCVWACGNATKGGIFSQAQIIDRAFLFQLYNNFYYFPILLFPNHCLLVCVYVRSNCNQKSTR